MKRVEATEELLRQFTADETLEARISTDFPISPSGPGSCFSGDTGERGFASDELKLDDNPWDEKRPSSPISSDGSDYSTIPTQAAPLRPLRTGYY